MKYLDNTGLAYFKGKLDTELATKQDSLVSGTNIKTINNESLLGSGDISVATTSDIPTKTSDLTNDSGFIDGLVILSYGNSNWNDFITAYNKNKVVYCRASSNSNPASGSQTRLAFMAYVNNATSPTEVEFQYYRSVSSHSDSQQGDQVFVYKLTSAGSWTVTTRNAFSKVVAGTGLSSSYSNGAITLSANAQTETDPIFTASAASGIASSDITNWNSKQAALVSGTNIKTVNNQSLLGSGDISITGGVSNIENGTEEGDLQQTGSTASGGYSFAEGFLTTASGEISHTEGFQTTASGAYSHAEGNYTKAIGEQSHAEGYRTTASGSSSHSEGNRTTASEGRAHAEGEYTTASGYASHAEGEYTTASGEGSHVEGEYTTAGGDYQHVFGKYNVIDNNSTYVEIVGNGNYNSGTQTTTRANARTLDWNGNEVLAGKLTVGANPTANMDVATKQYVDNLNTYSTNEIKVGTWIDDKPIYRKVINFGALPNTTTKSVAHGLTNIDFITDIRILSKNPTYSYYISIPYTNKSNVTYQVEFYIDATNVVITTGDNKSGYTNTYVILEYTKTTN